MTYRRFLLYASAVLFVTAIAGCAQEKEETSDEVQARVLDAYLQLYYPNATRLESGLVILDQKNSSSSEIAENYDAVYLNYNSMNLNGEYVSTTYKDVAKKLGTYSASTYYGPSFSPIGYGSITKGLHEALLLMPEGSEMTVVIPPTLSSYDTQSSNYTSQTHTTNMIYELKVEHVIKDLKKFQIDSLESFKRIHYPDIDSVVTGYYFKKTLDLGIDTIEAGTKVNVWYVGKLLDGYVFDTNIEDSAKKYDLYNSSTTYEALEIEYQKTFEEMSSESSSNDNSVVVGFARALKSLTYGEKGITFFMSDLGYGSSTSGSVPAYSMLFFDIYIEPEK